MLKPARYGLIAVMLLAVLLALHLTGVALREPVTPAVRAGALATWWSVVAVLIWGCVRAEAAVRRRVEAQRQRRLDAIAAGARFEADARWIRMGLGFLLILVLMGFGFWGALRTHRLDLLLAALCMTLALPIAVLYARMVLRPGPMLSMDLRGIDHASTGFIPWSAVFALNHETMTFRHSEQHALSLGVREPWRYLAQCAPLARWIKRAYRRERPHYGSFEIPLNMLDVAPEEIVAAAQALHARAGGERLEGWSRHLDPDSVAHALEMQRLHAAVEALPADADAATVRALRERTQRTLENGVAVAARQRQRARSAQWQAIALVIGLVLLMAWKLWRRLH